MEVHDPKHIKINGVCYVMLNSEEDWLYNQLQPTTTDYSSGLYNQLQPE